MNSAPISKIDRFNILKVLGSGSYGTVYLASYGTNKYAIKEMSMKHPMQSLWEVSLFNLMSHPNIIKPFEYLTSTNYSSMVIVMPESERTLKDAISLRITHPDIRLYTWQLLSAIDYLHSNSIVHRDIKPTNILLDDAHLYMIDFGISRFLNSNIGPTSNIAQTYTYRAPEVFRSFITNDTSSLGTAMDLWSVGMIILEMFSNRSYFSGYSEKDVMSILLSDRVSMIHDDIDILPVSDDIKRLLHSLLSVDPSARISARDAMKSPWFRNLRYQSAEYIKYPYVEINPTSNTAMHIKSVISPYLYHCRYTDQVLYQVLRYIKTIYNNNPLVLQDTSTMMRYYPILVAIAGNQIAEYNTDNTIGCSLSSSSPVYNVKDIYDIFTLLDYNIIIP